MTIPLMIIDSFEALENVIAGVQADFETVDYTAALEHLIGDLQDDHADMFANETAADGTPWAQLAPSTIQRKGHSQILAEYGDLGASLFGETSDSIRHIQRDGANNQHGLTFGTSDEKALFHQEGTKNMPARPPVGWSEERIEKAVNQVADEAVRQMTAGETGVQ